MKKYYISKKSKKVSQDSYKNLFESFYDDYDHINQKVYKKYFD